MATTITIAEQQVVVECDPGITNPQPAIESKPFQEWKKSIEGHKGLRVTKVTIQGIDMFGPRVGFVKFKADVELDGQFVPGIVFMRGGAVAILVVLVSGDEEYVVLTRQARVPIGEISYPEIPAGMLDGNGEFAGVAAKELKEEADLHIRSSELIDMTNLAYSSKFRGVYPSPGGCDEYIRLFLYKREVTVEELTAIRGKSGLGNREEGELISLDMMPLSELYMATSDGKSLAALCLYYNLRRDRKISGASATRPGGPLVATPPVGGRPNRARLRPSSWIGGAEQATGVDIVVLGEAHLDLSCSPTKSEVIDRRMSIKPGPQDLGSFDIALGGKGAIEAVCIARLGFDTHFFTKFGTLNDEAQASQRVDDEAQASQDELDFAASFMLRCLQCQTDGANKQRLAIHWSKEQSEVKEKHCKMQLASGACVILQNGSTNSNLNKLARLKHDDGVSAAEHALKNKASFLLLQDEVGSEVIETAVKITTRGDSDGNGDIAHSQSRTRNVLTCWPREGLDPEQNLQHLDVLVLQWRNLIDACPDRSARGELFKKNVWNMKDGMTAVTAIRSRMRGADSKNPDLRVEAKVVINTFENYVYIHGPGGPAVVPIPESKSENEEKADFVTTHDSMAAALVAGMMKPPPPPPDRETSEDSSRTFRCAAVRGAYMLAFSRSGSGMHLPIDESAFDAFISTYSGKEAMTGKFVAEEEHAV